MSLRSVLWALALCSSAVANGGAEAQTEHSVRFCFSNWAPYAVWDDTGANGISVDILRTAAQRAGLSAQFEELPWNRCLEMVRQGRIDAVIDAAGRDEFLQGPTSYSEYTNTFWTRVDGNLSELSFEKLRGKKIGLVNGYSYPEELTREIESAQLVVDRSVDDATAIRKLAFGRVDIIVGDYVGTLLFARKHNLKIRPLSPTHSSDRLYPSFHPSRGDLQRAIDHALQTMQADGSIKRIFKTHLGLDINRPDGAAGAVPAQ